MNPYCICDLCLECGGTGTIWWSPAGEYLGSSHIDDLDDLETCDTCRGSGLGVSDLDCPIHGYEDDEE